MLPCALHGPVELWPQNAGMWTLYLERIAPLALRTIWRPAGTTWQAETQLDWIVVLQLVQLYPLAPPRRMLEQIQAIFDNLQQE
jgi:hypothetical protein